MPLRLSLWDRGPGFRRGTAEGMWARARCDKTKHSRTSDARQTVDDIDYFDDIDDPRTENRRRREQLDSGTPEGARNAEGEGSAGREAVPGALVWRECGEGPSGASCDGMRETDRRCAHPSGRELDASKFFA